MKLIAALKSEPDKYPKIDYRQIVKTTSVTGFAQAVTYLISFMRTKAVAIFLGPSGVGLISLYISIIELVGSISRLGTNNSAVRQIALAANDSDSKSQLENTVFTVRRLCWVLGIAGWLLTAILSYPMSIWAFGSFERTALVALLGCSLVFSLVHDGNSALLQGTRQITALARMNVASSAVGTAAFVIIFYNYGEQGIVPALILNALICMVISSWFSRGIGEATVHLSWSQIVPIATPMIRLGLGFMVSAVAGSLAVLTIRSVIVKTHGIDLAGIYHAAWAVSAVLGNLITGSISSDFYPRLASEVHNNENANRVVNETIQAGILMTLPVVLLTISFSDWIMVILYTASFTPGAELLTYFAGSAFLTVISYPLGYILVAKAASVRYATITTAFHIAHVIAVVFLVQRYGIAELAASHLLLAVIYMLLMRMLVARLFDFKFTSKTVVLITIAIIIIFSVYIGRWLMPASFFWFYCLTLLVIVSVKCSHELRTSMKRASA